MAEAAGRSKTEIRQVDYEEAKREITGEVDRDLQNAVLDADDGSAALFRRGFLQLPAPIEERR